MDEKDSILFKAIIAFNILFEIQSPEWSKRTRNLDSVVW